MGTKSTRLHLVQLGTQLGTSTLVSDAYAPQLAIFQCLLLAGEAAAAPPQNHLGMNLVKRFAC
jgi:hypothetical protein